MLKMSYCRNKYVSIYACPGDKFLDYGKYACVKDLTSIMSKEIFSIPKNK